MTGGCTSFNGNRVQFDVSARGGHPSPCPVFLRLRDLLPAERTMRRSKRRAHQISKMEGRLIEVAEAARPRSGAMIGAAVCRSKLLSAEGLRERLFTLMFSNLVYPQIWEDPAVDLEALALDERSRIITIASGGCNVLSYLAAGPAQIIAVDINAAHVALNRLKLAAASHLPDYEAFYRFFGRADTKANIDAFKRYILPHLDT